MFQLWFTFLWDSGSYHKKLAIYLGVFLYKLDSEATLVFSMLQKVTEILWSLKFNEQN